MMQLVAKAYFLFFCGTLLLVGNTICGFSHVGNLQQTNFAASRIFSSFTTTRSTTLSPSSSFFFSRSFTSHSFAKKKTTRNDFVLFSHFPDQGSLLESSQQSPRKNKKRSTTTLASSTTMVQEDFNARSPLANLFSKIRNDLNEVSKWRIAAFTFIASIFAFSSKLDMLMIRFWHYLQNGTDLLPRMFRHDHWEWGVAVWAFFFWIHGFWLADRAVAQADAKGIVHPWKKYRLQDQYEQEKFRRMQLRKLEQQGEEDMDLEAKAPVVKQHKWHLGFWIFELPLYCIPLYIWDVLIPRRAAKIAAWGAPTALGVCKDVTCGLLLYDFGFFVCHYLMHKVPFLYKYVHAKHHTSTEVRASDIVRLSFVEEIVDVTISILALNYLRCHPISRTIYNIIITFMLTELHCGFAFPWTPQFIVPFGLATGSKGHHYHHRNGEHYYQKFFCHVDRLFGFVQKKDDTLKGFSVS